MWVCVGEKGKRGLRKLEKNNVNQWGRFGLDFRLSRVGEQRMSVRCFSGRSPSLKSQYGFSFPTSAFHSLRTFFSFFFYTFAMSAVQIGMHVSDQNSFYGLCLNFIHPSPFGFDIPPLTNSSKGQLHNAN